MDNLILATGIGFLLGALVALAAYHFLGTNANRNRRTEQQLEKLRDDYTRYQADVNEHFLETAQRLKRLNDSYRDVHQHLARGAMQLCGEPEVARMLDFTPREKVLDQDELTGDLEPPRDYAPKTQPDEKGTLAEDYGFARDGRRIT